MAQQRRVVHFDYQAKDSEELNITGNETITVLDSSGLWWKVVNDNGQSGLIPSNYLWGRGEGPEPTPAPSASSRTDLKADEPAHMYHQPDLMMNRANGPSLNITAKAKYKYQGNREDELTLEKGDVVVVMEKEADGWWKGRCGTKIGWFPFNYVEEVGGAEAAAVAAPEKALPQAREKKFVCGVIALYSFNSGNPEELTFQKGDLLDIVDQPEDDPDWWEARKADGQTGLIPRNYVEIVHDAEPVFGSEGGVSGQHKSAHASPALSSHPPPPFAHEVWYHGRVARKEAETLLNQRASHGQFIVRSSETKVGVCVCVCVCVSVCAVSSVARLLVVAPTDGCGLRAPRWLTYYIRVGPDYAWSYSAQPASGEHLAHSLSCHSYLPANITLSFLPNLSWLALAIAAMLYSS